MLLSRLPKQLPSTDDLSAFHDSPVAIAVVIALLIVSLGLHELGHAWTAWKCGDSTAKDQGRITLNPIPHIDPFMTILLPAILIFSGSPILFGGAKPVPVVASNLRHPARDMMLVALAGPLMNVFLAIVFLLAWKVLVYFEIYDYGGSRSALLPVILSASMYFNIVLAIFNMLPIPPLDGSRVLSFFMPSSVRMAYLRFEFIGMLLVFFLVLQGYLNRPLRAGINALRDFIHLITGSYWV